MSRNTSCKFKRNGFIDPVLALMLLGLGVASAFFYLAAPRSVGQTPARGITRAGQFAAATPRYVTKNIEDVRVGEYVLAKDPAESGAPALHQVIATPRNYTLNVVHTTLETGGELQSTRLHPFWVSARGWTDAKDLQPGDMLLHADGRHVRVSDVWIEQRRVDTFNLTVDGVHTYYVAAGGVPVLVHNVDVPGQGFFEFYTPPAPSGHGNSIRSTRPTTLYKLVDQNSGQFLKWGVTGANPVEGRYGAVLQRNGWKMVPVDTGTRADMLQIERFLTETRPGPLNREAWAGRRAGQLIQLGTPCP